MRHAPSSLVLALAFVTPGCVNDIDVGGGRGGDTADTSALEVLTPDGSGGEGSGADGSTSDGTDNGDGAGDGGAGDGGAGDPGCGAELCSGGDDGDRPPPSREEDCSDDIPNCNPFMGHAEPECWQDNRGGCSAEVLDAWCTRRTTGEVWDALHLEWVDERCDGDVALDENTFSCQQPGSEVLYSCTTPLVLVFAGETVSFTPDAGMTSFNLAPAGQAPLVRTDWPTAVTPWLAFDRDGDGQITSGAELFGSATPTKHGTARHGFAALTDLDDNADGIVDGKDPAFAHLLVWRDTDGDRVSTSTELTTAAVAGLRGIGVAFQTETRCDERGNCEKERGAFTFVDGKGAMQKGAVVDVHLVARDAPARVAAVQLP